MFLTSAATFGLVLWIILWSIGVKGFDAFMLTALILFLAATIRIVLPTLPGNRTE